MRLIGANPIAKVDGRSQNIARINYFIGRDPVAGTRIFQR